MNFTGIYIKNFRNIGSEGALIKISPVTFLTGCNSSGKSTATKALLLLDIYLKAVRSNDNNLIDTPLEFPRTFKLGSFDNVLNADSKAKGENYIVLGHQWESATFVGKVQADFTFVKKPTDSFNYGWLKTLSISIDSVELFTIGVEDGHYTLDIKDKDKFLEYNQYYLISQYASFLKDREEDRIDDETNNNGLSNVALLSTLDKRLLELYHKLTESGKIHKNMCQSAYDASLRNAFKDKSRDKELDILKVVENILLLSEVDYWIYTIETEEKRRLDVADFSRIIEMLRASQQKRCENWEYALSVEDINKVIERRSKQVLTYAEKYIQSDYTDILNCRRSQNSTLLDSMQQDLNDSETKEIVRSQRLNYNVKNWFGTVLYDYCFPFLNVLCEGATCPEFVSQIAYIDSSAIDVQRLYPADRTDRFGSLWRGFNLLTDANNLTDYYVLPERGAFMKKWLNEFGICDDVVTQNEEGLLRIKLITTNAPEGRLLADYGYGVTQLISLLLFIEYGIREAKYSTRSYASPSIFNINPFNLYKMIPSILIVEEPENHLHPSLQSRLADMFQDAARNGVHCIVETHSEYMIRRTQVLVAEMNKSETVNKPENPFRVYYFPTDGIPYDMGYRQNGKFIESFGTGFFDVADNSAMELFDYDEE